MQLSLTNRKIDSLQYGPGCIVHFHVPRAGPVSWHGLLAPRAPRRPAHLQLHVAHLGVSVEPHVVDASAPGTGYLGPAHKLADVVRERATRVRRLPIDHRPGEHCLRADVGGW